VDPEITRALMSKPRLRTDISQSAPAPTQELLAEVLHDEVERRDGMTLPTRQCCEMEGAPPSSGAISRHRSVGPASGVIRRAPAADNHNGSSYLAGGLLRAIAGISEASGEGWWTRPHSISPA